MLSVTYAGCHIQALHAECHYAECCYAECRHAECRGAFCDFFSTFIKHRVFSFSSTQSQLSYSGPMQMTAICAFLQHPKKSRTADNEATKLDRFVE
jgi:hypothetical protein